MKKRKKEIPNEETLQVIKDMEEGKNLVGPFRTVDELFEDLMADEEDE